MTQVLAEKLAKARTRLRSVVFWTGASWLIVTILAVLLGAGMTDWLFHVSPELRILFLIALFGAAGWVAMRHLLVPLSVAVSDLHLALRVERLHPELEESLSSLVEFEKLAANDTKAGSPILRQAVVDRASRQSESLNFDNVVNDRPRQRAIRWAIALSVVTVALIILNPLSASIAARRLASPYGGVEWPKRTIITKLDYVPKMAKGDPFTVTLDLTGVIPERMSIEYRFADGQQPPPSPMPPSVDTENRFVATLDAATQPFEFLITGGDASTGWIPVDVVPAPDVSELTITLTPPEYTRLPKVEYPAGRGHVQSVVGTRIDVNALSNKPLSDGKLVWQNGESTEARISDDKTHIETTFTVVKDDTYRILLTDDHGMTNEHRSPKEFRVQAIPDSAPEVIIEQPASDLEVTRHARQPLKILARDDFGVQDVVLRYRIESPPGTGQASHEPTDVFQEIPLHSDVESGASPKHLPIDHVWDLSTLKLHVGNVIVYKVTARDYRDSPEPNIGESRELRLRIVSESDFVRQIDAEQRLVREELDRLRKLQENALLQTTDLAEAADEKPSLDAHEREKLQSTETLQRRVREKANGPEGSIQERIKELLAKMAANRVDDLDTKKRLSLIDSELARIGEQHLSEIERSMIKARKESELAKGNSGSASKPSSEGPTDQQKPEPGTSRSANNEKQTPPGGEASSTESSGQASEEKSPSSDAKQPNVSSASKEGQSGSATAERSPAKTSPSPESASPDSAEPEERGSSPESLTKNGTGENQKAPEGQSPSEQSPENEQGESKPEANEAAPQNEAQKQVASALGDARQHQQQVVESLDAMLDQLDKWESVAEVVNEARDIERRQTENAEQVGEISKETLGKSKDDLNSDERAKLEQAAARQNEIREQLSRLERKLARQADKTQSEDPAAAEAMKDALEQSRKANLGGKMSETADNIRQNKLSDAGQSQEEISKSLRDLVESLENRREQELKRLVKELKEAEKALEQIREEQQRLRKETVEAEKIADAQQRKDALQRLHRRQQELQRKAEEFARRLSRLQSRSASQNSGRAASRMEEAGQSMQQGEGDQAGEKQEEALEQLEQAQQELAKQRQQAEEQLAQEQLAKVADAIKNIHQRQVSIGEDVKRLDDIRKEEGKLSRGQTQSVLGLSRAEKGLAEESAALQEKLSEAKVFHLVIEEAVSLMQDGADQLSKRETGDQTRKTLERAANRFSQLVESLAKDPQQQAGKQQQQQQGGQDGGQGGGNGNDGIPNIAQIKLLRTLQREIMEDTQDLAQAKADTGWTDVQKQSFEKLSERQGRLADIVRDFMKPEEEDPAAMPQEDQP